MNKLYTYSSGPLLESPNSYMYTPYHGLEFVAEYLEVRVKFLEHARAQLGNISSESITGTLVSSLRVEAARAELQALIPPRQDALGADSSAALEVLQRAIDSGEGNTERILSAALNFVGSADFRIHPLWSQVFSVFRRNIEVKRLLFESYQKGLKHGQGDHSNISNYCRLSALLAVGLDSAKDLRTLNALLKANDALLSVSAEITDRGDLELALLGVVVERSAVQELAEQEKIYSEA